MRLILNDVLSTWLLVEGSITDRIEVNGKKLVGVPLLTYSVAAPDACERSNYGTGVRSILLRKCLNVVCIVALKAGLLLALALTLVVTAQAERMKGQCVS